MLGTGQSAFGRISPQNMQSRVGEYFGDQNFGLANGFSAKYDEVYDISGQVIGHSWKGMSGLLQFFHKWPLGFIKSNWGRAVNQIIWNLLLFIIIPGAIYGSMIQNGSFSVPDGITKQTPDPYAQGFYFAVMTMTTLGFGDITPSTVGGQVMVMFHILLFFLFNFIWTLEFDPTTM